MATEITPSKKVYMPFTKDPILFRTGLTHHCSQAASAIESFRMESPVKKLDFTAASKENAPFDADVHNLANQMDAQKPTIEKPKEESKPAVAPGIKAHEAEEPILQENPQRFVLFPIKYHEVSDASTRKVDFDATWG